MIHDCIPFHMITDSYYVPHKKYRVLSQMLIVITNYLYCVNRVACKINI